MNCYNNYQLTDDETKILNDWHAKLTSKYPVVGKITYWKKIILSYYYWKIKIHISFEMISLSNLFLNFILSKVLNIFFVNFNIKLYFLFRVSKFIINISTVNIINIF
jgi:hypothetical protein